MSRRAADPNRVALWIGGIVAVGLLCPVAVMLVVELLWVYGSALRVTAPTVVVYGCGGVLPNFFESGWEVSWADKLGRT